MSRPALRFQWLVDAIKRHGLSKECLLWPFGKIPDGYGCVKTPSGETELVHRVAFKLTYGRFPVPEGRHTCDEPACFNPRHIIEGTHADNVADMISRGRTSFIGCAGEDNIAAKLTNELVRQIRREYVPRKHQHLDRKFGVDRKVIHLIVTRQIWRHI